jgi:hypothetical protein
MAESRRERQLPHDVLGDQCLPACVVRDERLKMSVQEVLGDGHADPPAASWRTSAGRLEHGIEVSGATHRQGLEPYAKGARCGHHRMELGFGTSRIPQHGDTGGSWDHFLKELQAFPGEVDVGEDESGDVPARSREADDQTTPDGVAPRSHHDRDRFGRGRGGTGDGIAAVGHDDVNWEPDEFGRQLGQTLELAVREPELEGDILALDIAQRSQRISTGVVRRRRRRRSGTEDADAGILGVGCAPTAHGTATSAKLPVTNARRSITRSPDPPAPAATAGS